MTKTEIRLNNIQVSLDENSNEDQDEFTMTKSNTPVVNLDLTILGGSRPRTY